MTTITIANEVSAQAVAKIRELLDDVALRDINWNGAEFQLERGDFTCIENDDSHEAALLLRKIDDIIAGY